MSGINVTPRDMSIAALKSAHRRAGVLSADGTIELTEVVRHCDDAEALTGDPAYAEHAWYGGRDCVISPAALLALTCRLSGTCNALQ